MKGLSCKEKIRLPRIETRQTKLTRRTQSDTGVSNRIQPRSGGESGRGEGFT